MLNVWKMPLNWPSQEPRAGCKNLGDIGLVTIVCWIVCHNFRYHGNDWVWKGLNNAVLIGRPRENLSLLLKIGDNVVISRTVNELLKCNGVHLCTVGGLRSNFSLSLHASASHRPLQLTTITRYSSNGAFYLHLLQQCHVYYSHVYNNVMFTTLSYFFDNCWLCVRKSTCPVLLPRLSPYFTYTTMTSGGQWLIALGKPGIWGHMHNTVITTTSKFENDLWQHSV